MKKIYNAARNNKWNGNSYTQLEKRRSIESTSVENCKSLTSSSIVIDKKKTENQVVPSLTSDNKPERRVVL